MAKVHACTEPEAYKAYFDHRRVCDTCRPSIGLLCEKGMALYLTWQKLNEAQRDPPGQGAPPG